MRRIWAFAILIFTATMIVACTNIVQLPAIDIPQEYIKDKSSGIYTENEKLCISFVENKMTGMTGGIKTNYLNASGGKVLASGHEVLSESEGLVMLYYANNGNKEMFDRHYSIVANKFLMPSGTVRWRIDYAGHIMENTSASIDDLRLVRAMVYAYDMWGDDKYLYAVDKISKGLLKYTTYKNSLVNYYDEDSRYMDNVIDLSYIDLLTLKIMEGFGEKNWTRIIENDMDIINGGYIGNEFPFYKKVYNIKNKSYDKNKNINMIDTLLVVLHLSELGIQRQESIDWLKETLKYGPVYAIYNLERLDDAAGYESTAVYAIIARIAKNIGDHELHNMAVKRMLSLQVNDETSQIYGSFGDRRTLEVFSFDNLQALLGF